MNEFALLVGVYIIAKYRLRVLDADGNVQHVAAQLKKQGVPIEIALALLCWRPAARRAQAQAQAQAHLQPQPA